MAQAAADAELRESKRGIDETEASVVALHPELGLSASTICRWVDAGNAEMTDLDLRRKVSCEKNHEEIRKLLSKGRDDGFEQLTRRRGGSCRG